MTSIQRVIKYLAIAFAIFIIVNIISAIFFGLYQFANILGLTKTSKNNNLDKAQIIENIQNSDISTLNMDINFTELTIKTGEYLKVETNSKNITCKQNNESLYITENNHNWFTRDNDNELVLYIPENFKFEEVKINTGAGKIDIDTINAENLSLSLGAGKVKINNLNVSELTKINGGAGKVEILNGSVNDLKLDMGVGKFSITSKITGNSKIGAGIGKLDINLLGQEQDYTIKASKGIGSININGKNAKDDTEYGNGTSTIKVEGGIGSIDINI